jgi:RNA polymerase sigma-70 factor (ECF subfamily)
VTPGEAGERFAVIFREHQQAVHAYLIGRTGDQAQASDLTQEVFLRGWRHLPDLLVRNPAGQRAWLFTVARNIAVDESRRARTRAETLASLTALDPASRRSAGAEAEAVDDLDRVAVAVAALPEDLRTCLAMATTGEMSSQQIGAALGIPAGTVRYRLSRARGSLQRALAADRTEADGAPTVTPPTRRRPTLTERHRP